jgi:ABC-type lipoprotein export system ATPase subunit
MMGIRATGVAKSMGQPLLPILKDITIEIATGEFIALTGRSGSGKSTLLYLLSSLDIPTNGKIEIDGQDVASMESDQLHRFRNQKMGFVFQFHYLLAELKVLENVLMPTLKFDQREKYEKRAIELLNRFGIGNKFDRFPRELSGGEQQRVAIARALVMQPRYLFADEPTGSLDSANSKIVMDILRSENKAGTTVVMVTHDHAFAKEAQRIIELSDGRVVHPGELG